MPDSGRVLAGKVALVTGAGRYRGIGRAAALALARMGADVVVTGTGRDPSTFPEDEKAMGWRDVESAAREIEETGRRALALTLDVTDAAAVEGVVRRTLSEFGRIDILVNNAAAARADDRLPVVEVDDDVFRRVLDVKVMGTYLCSKAVARRLIAQGEGGRIVNLSSTAGKRGSANTAAYNAANFAIDGFTQALAKELARYNITVNAVCPGVIDTARMDALGRGDAWRRREKEIPLGRAGTDAEVGELIAFLCSPAAGYITGQAININGGSLTER